MRFSTHTARTFVLPAPRVPDGRTIMLFCEKHSRTRKAPQITYRITGSRTHEPDDQGSDGQTLSLVRHDQLEIHLADFINAYNYARRLKTLDGLTPYEYICKIWSEQLESIQT